MSASVFLFCEGIGCQLRERCQLYADGRDAGGNDPSRTLVSCCPDDEYAGYLPVTK